MSKPPSLFRRLRDLTWRGPSSRWLVIVAVASIVILTGLLAAGLAGLSQGIADQRIEIGAQVEERLNSGLAYLQNGQQQLAAAEFEEVLRLDPGNAQAQQALQAMQTPPTPTPAPSLAPLLLVPPNEAAPTGTPEPVVLATDELFAQAQAAIDQKQWDKAAEALDRLAGLDPAYRTEEISALRFEALRQHGLELVAAERYEEALRSFDQALTIDPTDAEAKTERELIALYVDALGLWRLDWARVIQDLETIKQQRPAFLDVQERLALANDAWGDALSKEGDWCQAAERFTAAVLAGASADVQVKAAQAELACQSGPALPAETPSADATPGATVAASSSARAGSGRLVFSTYSPEFNRWSVYRLLVQGGRQPEAIADSASQPDMGPYGDFIVARSERNDQTGLVVLSVNGSDRRRLTTYFEDSHPSWSGDGSQVVFESNREGDRRWRIYRVGAGGGDSVFLDYGRWPSWSPRGGTIAYQGCDQTGGRCGLFLINDDGSNPRSITGVPGDAMPAWSPDGSRIAFASADRGGSWDVFVLDLATGNVATLAASPGVDAHPVWSPDGRQVAFLSNRDGVWAIYAIDVATGRTQQMAALPGSLPDWFEAQLSWGK